MAPLRTALAWATDPELRRNGSSGGFVRAMLGWMLRTGRIDAAVVARTGEAGQPFAPGFAVVDDPEELRSRRYCSVYYPTDPFETVLQPGLKYAITLLPCQVERLRVLQQGGAWRQVRYVFELLCNYVPSPEWTERIFKLLEVERPNEVAYRGDGWPGQITVDGRSMPYLTCWRNDVDMALPRCLSCRRTCGEADWICGDPWGLRPRDVGDGQTLVRMYTGTAWDLTTAAVSDKAVCLELDGGLMKRRLAEHARRR